MTIPVDTIDGIHHSCTVQEPIGSANIPTNIWSLTIRAWLTNGESAGHQPITRCKSKILVQVDILALQAPTCAAECYSICYSTCCTSDVDSTQGHEAAVDSVKLSNLLTVYLPLKQAKFNI